MLSKAQAEERSLLSNSHDFPLDLTGYSNPVRLIKALTHDTKVTQLALTSEQCEKFTDELVECFAQVEDGTTPFHWAGCRQVLPLISANLLQFKLSNLVAFESIQSMKDCRFDRLVSLEWSRCILCKNDVMELDNLTKEETSNLRPNEISLFETFDNQAVLSLFLKIMASSWTWIQVVKFVGQSFDDMDSLKMLLAESQVVDLTFTRCRFQDLNCFHSIPKSSSLIWIEFEDSQDLVELIIALSGKNLNVTFNNVRSNEFIGLKTRLLSTTISKFLSFRGLHLKDLGENEFVSVLGMISENMLRVDELGMYTWTAFPLLRTHVALFADSLKEDCEIESIYLDGIGIDNENLLEFLLGRLISNKYPGCRILLKYKLREKNDPVVKTLTEFTEELSIADENVRFEPTLVSTVSKLLVHPGHCKKSKPMESEKDQGFCIFLEQLSKAIPFWNSSG